MLNIWQNNNISMQGQNEINNLSPLSYDKYIQNINRRSRLKAINHLVAHQEEESNESHKKTSQIKLIQKFIGRLKADNKNHQAILLEMNTLNFNKYLQEISNIIATSINQKQMGFYSEIATGLNSNYEGFSTILIEDLVKVFNNAFQSPDDNSVKLRALLMYITELYSIGFALSYKIIIEMLKKIFKSANKKKTIYNTQTQRNLFAFYYNSDSFATFLIHYSELFTKRMPLWVKGWMEQQKQVIKLPQSVPIKSRQDLTNFFVKYLTECQSVLALAYTKIKEYQDNLRQNLKLEGQFNRQIEKKYNDIVSKYRITTKNLKIISDALQQKIQIVEQQIIGTEDIMKRYVNKVEDAEIFQDQFQRAIYQNLIEFTSIEQKNTKEEDYVAIRQKLNQCKNTNDADEIITDFIKINNKKTRKALVKDILQYRKDYQLLTPYLCRIIATINQNFKDIGQLASQQLMLEYEKLKDSPLSNFVTNDKKSRNLKYIYEFTKFKTIDGDKCMNAIKYFIDDLKGNNIELLIMGLDSVGRFLYLSPTTANKFTFILTQLQNTMNAKSLPVFITSRLNNSINLLKPHKETVASEKIIKSEIQIKVDKIFSKSIIDDLNQILQQIKQVIKTQEGMKIIKHNIMNQIEHYEFLGNYNYAFMLDELNNQEINNFVVQKTVQQLSSCINTSSSQKTLLWSRFFGEIYKYGLIKRSFLYSTIKQLLKIQNNNLMVIKSICVIFKTCEGYLQCKKVSTANQQFSILLQLKKLVSKIECLPMLQEFAILEVFEEYEPYLAFLKNDQLEWFEKYLKQKTEKSIQNEFDLSNGLKLWIQENKIPLPKKKKELSVDTREINIKVDEIQQEQSNQASNIQQIKAFDQEYTGIIDSNIREFTSRIAKPIIQEKNIQKKKDKKPKPNSQTNNQNEKQQERVINVIGRSGNRYVRKEITYHLKE